MVRFPLLISTALLNEELPVNIEFSISTAPVVDTITPCPPDIVLFAKVELYMLTSLSLDKIIPQPVALLSSNLLPWMLIVGVRLSSTKITAPLGASLFINVES